VLRDVSWRQVLRSPRNANLPASGWPPADAYLLRVTGRGQQELLCLKFGVQFMPLLDPELLSLGPELPVAVRADIAPYSVSRGAT
jgi:hypothetical protein